MKVFFALINIGFLFFVAFRLWKKDQDSIRWAFWPALSLKLVAGVCLGLIYEYYYTVGDTLVYFGDGVQLADFARRDAKGYLWFLWSSDQTASIWNNLNFLQSRALLMVKIVSVVNLIAHDNYWVSSLYFSFLSFLTSWGLVKVIIRANVALRHAATAAFLFFPSVVFWSSGLIKESLAMASLFFLSAIFLKCWLRENVSWWEWIGALLAMWLTWMLKYYYLAVFLSVVIPTILVKLFFAPRVTSRPLFLALVWVGLFFVQVTIASTALPNFYPHRFLGVIVSNHDEFVAISGADDLIHYHSLRPSVGSILQNVPLALFSGLFRKLPWEAHTALQFFSSVENMLLILLTVASLVNIRMAFESPERLLLFSIVAYAVLLCVFLALSSPNFGTLSRYRVSFLPYYLLLVSIENPILKWMAKYMQRSSDRLVR